MPEKVTMYKTIDNCVFQNEEDANNHEVFLDFKEWYENYPGHKVWLDDENFADPNDVFNWILDNADDLYNVCDTFLTRKDEPNHD